MSAFFTRFGRTLRIIFKVPAAVLTTFTTCFRSFFTIFSKISGTTTMLCHIFTSCISVMSVRYENIPYHSSFDI
ncbi:hypothetical protein ACW63_17165 [Klebsiella quasipneumoniae subsp. quasipneumoniae]|nr:hypothetical protein ACW63_17165 [Klebsiella quasipneumoniae subsp. quasipneumoniae]